MTRDEENMLSRNLSNNQIQDILDDLGMIDDNGCCPYTAEEIFKAGVNYADSHPREGLWDARKVCEWLRNNSSKYMTEGINYPHYAYNSLVESLQKAMEE